MSSSQSPNELPVQHDTFLSQVLKRNCYNVSGIHTEVLPPLPKDADFLTRKIPASQTHLSLLLQDEGWRLIEVAVTFEGTPNPMSSPLKGFQVRFAEKSDESAVCMIANNSFRYSRFHQDPKISSQTANTIKESWVRNFFHGSRGDWLLLAESIGKNPQVVGFLLGIQIKANLAVVDLYAVHPEFQGRGIGTSLLVTASQIHGQKQTLRVGTQLNNIHSVRALESLRLDIVDVKYVFHRHKE